MARISFWVSLSNSPDHELQVPIGLAYMKPILSFVHSKVCMECSLKAIASYRGKSAEPEQHNSGLRGVIIRINTNCDSLGPIRR